MSRVEPSLFDAWGREVVKDALLLLLALPPIVGLLWWLARRGLRAWVARGAD